MPFILVLIVGICLWLLTSGWVHTVGEVLTIIAAVVLAVQLVLLIVLGKVAVATFRKHWDNF